MSQLGLGVMINMLRGNEESVKAWEQSKGKKIVSLVLDKEANILKVGFKGHTLCIQDNGQSCCESRYMVCDDKLEKFVGGKLMGLTLETAPDPPKKDEWEECHEMQFLHVKTGKGSFTVSNHVEHNGYYGGFSIELSVQPAAEEGA